MSQDTTTSSLMSLAVDDATRVATVTLHARAIPPAWFDELQATFDGIEARVAQGEVRAVVVRSDAKGFSYGLDLPAAFAAHGKILAGGGLAGPRTQLRALIRRWQGALTAVAQCTAPVVAAVHGWCIGGGVDLISAADVRVCSADARFSVRETRVAIVADLGSLQRLPLLIGHGHTRRLALTGEDFDAARAEHMGLVSEVAEDRDAAWSLADDLAQQIARNAPLTVQGVKRVLRHAEGPRVADGLEYVATWNSAFLSSKDLGEAVSAFTSKREPAYKGE